MKKLILIQQIFLILFFTTILLNGQDSDLKMAKKYVDRGMAVIETAESLEDFNEAIIEFEKAKTYAPNWEDIYYNLGFVYDKTEKYEEAIKNLRQYLKLVPDAEDADEVESMLNKIEYKNEKAAEKQNRYKDLLGIWDRYDSATGEKLDFYTFSYEGNNITVKTYAGIGTGFISVPVNIVGDKLEFKYLEKQTQYDSEVEYSYTIVDPKLMKGYIRVNVIRKNPGFPVPLGQKPPMPMEMRKR